MTKYNEWQGKNPQKAQLLSACAKAVRRVIPDAEVILFGSVARGDASIESDIDLLVLVPHETTSKLKE